MNPDVSLNPSQVFYLMRLSRSLWYMMLIEEQDGRPLFWSWRLFGVQPIGRVAISEQNAKDVYSGP